MGDFNSTLSIDDRLGGNQIANSDMEGFLSCTTVLGIEDAFSVGSHYIWTNGSHWAKLDRVLLNSTWNSLNINYQVEFLQYNSLSDHTPIMVNLSAQVQTKDEPFKILNMWMAHHDFMNIVRDYWQTPFSVHSSTNSARS